MDRSRQPPDLVGQSQAFQEALAHASSAAALDRPLLICGERGSGKELIAARIHFLSPRWEGPFIKLNCAALAETLLDSELFGHEVGAFTGATKRHQGRFERAEGGTLFLDEIASASLGIQEKLLRVIAPNIESSTVAVARPAAAVSSGAIGGVKTSSMRCPAGQP